ncbi:MAG: hypothetical protein A3G49_01885 [Candidatus Sungbacteria bacterium RIFCSPLOWO2_12_FULL_41_11]|uniref:Tyrosine specific protein phosphatases domain-containing protein n=1 Tax=Candidatus Sungbacteria bacterium RIFCSPLOWO2_12_FULL_41_11 TaxID=1802286 RepID=A0A1G2LRY3_9BACT|nr:MAG: hypothetical protein UV01_C0009G0055 [Parcubacteria group bacterium GW2011_GWA2_42_14]OGZ99429.1 MAG: hypothetical protein A3D41_00655 [Candidatus Sungbacteria bacterium RIFCSPHIGHO2_02_FULL_41_12b]OHA14357.1 MAG: hypothetical protein A3G49_01885 [Candidatus Sungbacteria bacterium RIFCSPLOWO2_12_FULL_41_11]
MLQPLISLICEKLYLGNAAAATDKDIINRYAIKKIFSVTDNWKHRPDERFCADLEIEQKILPISDEPFTGYDKVLVENIFPWIKKGLEAERGVLIHCAAGASRSPSATMAYLVWSGMVSPEDSIVMVLVAHPCAAPDIGVLKSFFKTINSDIPDIDMVEKIFKKRRNQMWWKFLINL